MKIRQQAPELSGIRADHVARYQFALDMAVPLVGGGRVLDVGCGVGYGSRMMSDAGYDVTGIDPSQEAIKYAEEHYADGKIKFLPWAMEGTGMVDLAFITMFEVIEHSEQAPAFMANAAKNCRYLFGSVPNERVVPFTSGGYNTEHYRHYTADEITEELNQAGWVVTRIGSQYGKRGPGANIRTHDTSGRTIVFMAESTHA